MEDIERFLWALKQSISITKKIEDKLEDDKQSIQRGLSGESETVYKRQCDQAIEKIKKIEKQVKVLYSESSAGL